MGRAVRAGIDHRRLDVGDVAQASVSGRAKTRLGEPTPPVQRTSGRYGGCGLTEFAPNSKRGQETDQKRKNSSLAMPVACPCERPLRRCVIEIFPSGRGCCRKITSTERLIQIILTPGHRKRAKSEKGKTTLGQLNSLQKRILNLHSINF